jgi:hypothetical protein
MKRTIVGLLIGALLLIGGPARADVQPCNLKAVRHTAAHLAKAKDPVRVELLQARYERLTARCTMPDPPG